MTQVRMACIAIVAFFSIRSAAFAADPVLEQNRRLAQHVDALSHNGAVPQEFVLRKLAKHDLIIFDDGLHTAADPFEFYEELVRSPQFQSLAPYLFLEVVPLNRQPALDAYLNAPDERPELLFPAFQNDFGWPYQSYFDLLKTVREVNSRLPPDRRIKVFAVSTPEIWKEIGSHEDYAIHADTDWIARDYLMFGMIREALADFGEDKKGIFLTNTRHAYRNLRLAQGTRAHSVAAFFDEWRPGKSYVMRFHSPALSVRRAGDSDDSDISWARVGSGLWDEAFAAYGAVPVAIELAGTPFGDAPYVGNLMPSAEAGQTMRDVNDAIIFLKPIEELRKTAITSSIYTKAFRRELERRFRIARTEAQLEADLREAGVASVPQLIRKTFVDAPEAPLPQSAALPPVDQWRREPVP